MLSCRSRLPCGSIGTTTGVHQIVPTCCNAQVGRVGPQPVTPTKLRRLGLSFARVAGFPAVAKWSGSLYRSPATSGSGGGDAIASLSRWYKMSVTTLTMWRRQQRVGNGSMFREERYEKHSDESAGYCVGSESSAGIRSGRENGTDDRYLHHERRHR